MDREYLFTLLMLAVTGLGMFAASGRQVPRARATPAGREEHACWRRLWAPVAPSLVGACALLGWVFVQREPAELIPRSVAAVSALVAAVWLRAGLRAARAMRTGSTSAVAATVGLWRPRTTLSPDLIAQLDAETLAAVGAHEAAHVRHRDPLRLWLAQFVTDVQWPRSGAPVRFHQWRRALELARDEEARRAGVHGANLAAGILAAARLESSASAGAALTGTWVDLEDRVARLLAPLPADRPHSDGPMGITLAVTCGVAAWVGARFGITILSAMFHVLP
jgi:hypothetical protein